MLATDEAGAWGSRGADACSIGRAGRRRALGSGQYDGASTPEMPPVPDVSAIVKSVKSRIKQIEGELAKHEPPQRGARTAAGRARSTRRGSAVAGERAARGCPAGGPIHRSRQARWQNKAKVLEALKDGPMTASEIANATGIASGTVSTLLTELSKSGEVVKAGRGYRLPERPE